MISSVKSRISRRTLEVAAALFGMVTLLGIGAHAAYTKRTDIAPRPAAAASQAGPQRLALVIGNARYPDAGTPLAQPVNDARALTAALRQDGFDVDVIENGGRDDMLRAVERLKARITSDATVMLYFGGYAVQSGRQSFMIPVDATIWREADVRRSGVSIESVFAAMQERGAQARLGVIDAARRNPYERRFRTFSHGLAPIEPGDRALVLTAAEPGRLADDIAGENSLLVKELLGTLRAQGGAAAVFGATRDAVARASDGAQVPMVSSSLADDVPLGSSVEANADRTGG